MAWHSTPVSSPIASPCIGICLLDADERCTGCGRTLPEIAEWPLADESRRRSIVNAATARLAAMKESIDQPERRA